MKVAATVLDVIISKPLCISCRLYQCQEHDLSTPAHVVQLINHPGGSEIEVN